MSREKNTNIESAGNAASSLDVVSGVPGKAMRGMKGTVATIMTLYFLSPTISAISPAMSSIAGSYPDVSPAAIGYVMTITAALQAVTALIAGALAGRKLRYRTLAIASSILVVIAGCIPFFLSGGADFPVLIGSRALLGIGLGTIMPLSNALVLAAFSDEGTRSRLIGVGNAMLNVGTIVTNLLGGFLCAISWQSTFLVYALGIVLFALSAFAMKEPAHVEEENVERKKGSLPAVTFVYIVFFLLMCVMTQPVIVYCSQVLAEAGITNAMVSAFMVSVFSIGGIIISLMFTGLFKLLGKMLLPASFVVAAVALLVCFMGGNPQDSNVILYGIGAALAGMALLMVTCFTPMAISQVVAPEMQSTAMGFVSFAMGGGTFLSTPFAQLAGIVTGAETIGTVLMFAACCSGVLAVVAVAFVFLSRRKK